MSQVHDWFEDFVQEHLIRCQRTDLPSPDQPEGEVYWDAWRRAFILSGVTYDIATQASSAVATRDLYPNQQLPAITDECNRIFRERRLSESAGYTPGSRDAAEAATPADCECSRGGIVIRFRHRAVGNGQGTSAAGVAISCFCTCPMGVWTRDNVRPEERRRFLDLSTRPDLQLRPVPWSDGLDNPHRYKPSEWDSDLGQPRAVEGHYAADKDAMVRGVVRSREMPQRAPRALPAYVEPTAEEIARAADLRGKMFGPSPG